MLTAVQPLDRHAGIVFCEETHLHVRKRDSVCLLQVTAMHLAAENGHFALITLLVEHGGDATALDGYRCGLYPRYPRKP